MYYNWIHLLVVLLVTVAEVSKTSDEGEEIEIDAQLRRVRSAPRVKRIIGGSSINNGQWPWLVSLYGQIPSSSWGWITTSYLNIYCGGSLIAPNWILTAAHCFSSPGAPAGIKSPDNWSIKLGDVKRTVTGILDTLRQYWTSLTNQQTATWYYIEASKIVVHPMYDPNNLWANDIALLKLDMTPTEFPDNPYIKPVPLPVNVSGDWPPVGSNCSMQGWGCTVQGGPLQTYAQSVILPILGSTICAQVFGDIGPDRLCAGYNLGNMGICKGDSGGPLACLNGDTWIQAGIASFASGDNSGNWPGGFTRVQSYLSWINSVIAAG